jgi:hypothetical protein
MKYTLIFIVSLFTIQLSAQTWSDNVAQIFYNKCSKCHHQGGIGSIPLTTYQEVSPIANFIKDYIETDEMPPWPPNNNYQTYVHDRSLTVNEKSTILNWITANTPEGNASNTPPVPSFTIGSILGQGDLEVKIPRYMSKAQNGKDDYVCFSIPSGLTSNKIIKSVEIIPGNPAIVHHALIFVDPSGVESTDTISGQCSSPSSTATKLIAGYTPGSSPLTLPSVDPLKLGINLPSGSNIYFEMHYPEGSYGQFDSTKVIFHFYPDNETNVREVFAAPVVQNWFFTLPPNVETEVEGSYGPLQTNISLLSVFPHMHLLGKSIKSYNVSSTNDTIPLIDIPKWDFHWQDFYFFKNIVKVPIGSYIKGEGVYDNTDNNHHNPNSPPITVYPGLNTSDEMFLIYFHYMYYQTGDENYNIEELMTASLNEVSENHPGVKLFPNPIDENLTIELNTKIGDVVSLYVYDSKGVEINRLLDKSRVEEERQTIKWEPASDLRSGIYFLSFNINGELFTKKVIKK